MTGSDNDRIEIGPVKRSRPNCPGFRSHQEVTLYFKPSPTFALASAAMLIAALSHPPVQAQTTPALAVAAPSVQPVCMVSPVLLSADGTSVVAMVPGSQQPALSARGFQTIDCSMQSVDFATYRANICQLANTATADQIVQYQQNYNVTPTELCAWSVSASNLGQDISP